MRLTHSRKGNIVKHKPRTYQSPQKCHGKNCYRSEKEALIVAREQELLDIKGTTNISVYKCQFCGYYHLTSNEFHEENNF